LSVVGKLLIRDTMILARGEIYKVKKEDLKLTLETAQYCKGLEEKLNSPETQIASDQ